MKTLKSIALAAVIMLTAGAFAQTVVFEENFQTFKEEGFRNGSDTLPCPKKKVHSKANFKVTKMYDGTKITYSFMKAGVAPTCDSKKSPSNVSTGLVRVRKDGGEFTINNIPEVGSIIVEASATGDVRGYALMKSVDGGAWTKVGEYIGAKSEGQDAQYGFVNTIAINEKNVSLKFVPCMGGKDEQELREFCIHAVKVMK